MKILGNQKRLLGYGKKLANDFLKKKTQLDTKVKEKPKKRKNSKALLTMNNVDELSSFTDIIASTPNNKLVSCFSISNSYFSINYQNEEEMNLSEIPSTPHNTSQFLSSNYISTRGTQIYNYIFQLQQEQANLELDSLDDICFTGGTMKEIMNLKHNNTCPLNCVLRMHLQNELIKEQNYIITTLEQELRQIRNSGHSST
jgi:hypothetical protein